MRSECVERIQQLVAFLGSTGGALEKLYVICVIEKVNVTHIACRDFGQLDDRTVDPIQTMSSRGNKRGH